MPRCLRAAWFAVSALAVAFGSSTATMTGPSSRRIVLASYYGSEFDSLRTASGERFDPRRMTAAHRTLPFGTRVLVTNLENGHWAVVRINDRGPFVKGRALDLSYAAARELGLVGAGVGPVSIAVLPRDWPAADAAHRRAWTGSSRRAGGATLGARTEALWRRRSIVPWGPIAARLDLTKSRIAIDDGAPAGS